MRMGAPAITFAVSLAASLCVSCASTSQAEEPVVEFRRATKAPGTADPHENPFRSLTRDPWLEACQPCEVLDWATPSGRARTLHVSIRPEAVLKPDEVRRVIVRERLPFGGETPFFTVEVETTTGAAHVGKSLADLAGRLLVVRVNGSVVGVEATSREWVNRLRIGTFATEEEATRVATRLGTQPTFEYLSEDERQAERESFVEFGAGFFWVNVCEPSSVTAREQHSLWTKTKEAYPELLDRIDCSQPPRPMADADE